MRFLCFHGMGTNAKVFERQTARLREALGRQHQFHFFNGSVPADPATGCEGLGCYRYDGDLDQVNSMYKNLLQIMTEKGPFDGLIGFSEGGGVASSLLVQDARQSSQPCGGGGGQQQQQKFKCGIFFSAATPVDPAIVQTGERREMNMSTDGVVINVPTAHIWSPKGDVNPGMGQDLVHLCDEGVREEFVHHLGHEVPGSLSNEYFAGALRVVERTIERAKM